MKSKFDPYFNNVGHIWDQSHDLHINAHVSNNAIKYFCQELTSLNDYQAVDNIKITIVFQMQ